VVTKEAVGNKAEEGEEPGGGGGGICLMESGKISLVQGAGHVEIGREFQVEVR
jgi:hypothetical protein